MVKGYDVRAAAGEEIRSMIESEAARLGAWLVSTHVIPRFPSPLQKELVG